MKLVSGLLVLQLSLAVWALPMPPKNSKGRKPSKPKNHNPAASLGDMVKVKPVDLFPKQDGPDQKHTDCHHPAVIIGSQDANGRVPLTQLSHGPNAPFTHYAHTEEIVPTLAHTPGFDNRKNSQSKINVGEDAIKKAHVNDLKPWKEENNPQAPSTELFDLHQFIKSDKKDTPPGRVIPPPPPPRPQRQNSLSLTAPPPRPNPPKRSNSLP